MEFYDFPYSVGNGKSSQLTFTPSFFRGVGIPPTSIYCHIFGTSELIRMLPLLYPIKNPNCTPKLDIWLYGRYWITLGQWGMIADDVVQESFNR